MANCYTSKHFANKIWQAFKYLETAFEKVPENVSCKLEETDMNIFDRWILSRMVNAIKTVEESLQNYNFAAATQALRLFIYEDFCSTYLVSHSYIFKHYKNISLKILDSHKNHLHCKIGNRFKNPCRHL